MSQKLRIIKQDGEKKEVLSQMTLLHDMTDQKLIVIKSEKEIPYDQLKEMSKLTDAVIICLPNDIDLSVYSFELVEE